MEKHPIREGLGFGLTGPVSQENDGERFDWLVRQRNAAAFRSPIISVPSGVHCSRFGGLRGDLSTRCLAWAQLLPQSGCWMRSIGCADDEDQIVFRLRFQLMVALDIPHDAVCGDPKLAEDGDEVGVQMQGDAATGPLKK